MSEEISDRNLGPYLKGGFGEKGETYMEERFLENLTAKASRDKEV